MRRFKKIPLSNIHGVVVLQYKLHSDARGASAEIFRQDDEPEHKTRISMGYWSTIEPQAIKGPHEHRHQSDRFVFFGPGMFELHLWDNRPDITLFPVETHEKLYIGDSNPCAVIIPPGVVHGYKNTSSFPAVVLNFPDRLYRGWNYGDEVDEIRHEDNPSNPFIIT